MVEHANVEEGQVRRCVSMRVASEDLTEPEKKLKSFKDKSLLECITAETVADLLQGAPHMRELYDRVVIIDCRYQYEFDGGHMRVPPHLADWIEVLHIAPHESDKAMDLLFNGGGARALPPMSLGQDRVCAIFHCEFSQRRGPDMYRKVRGEDRRRVPNERYPDLFYPEMYVMHSGYKRFWETCPDLCEPREYVAENDERFTQDCERFSRMSQGSKLKYTKKKPPPRRGLHDVSNHSTSCRF
jgi:hypothetical protein